MLIGKTFVLHTKVMGSSPIISKSPVSIVVVQWSFKPLTRVQFPHRGLYFIHEGIVSIGKTMVFKIKIVGSNPTTFVSGGGEARC